MATSAITFDNTFYLAQNRDVAAAIQRGEFSTGFDHFIKNGAAETRDPNAYFDISFYLEQYPDLVRARANAFDHFVAFGALENRFSNQALKNAIDTNGNGIADEFNAAAYLTANPDVATAVQAGKLTAFSHYVEFGQFEARQGAVLVNGTVLTGPFASDGTSGGSQPVAPPPTSGGGGGGFNAPSYAIGISPTQVAEDSGTAFTYTVTRTGDLSRAATVTVALSGEAVSSDYTTSLAANTVSFAANAATATFTLTPTADVVVEANETVVATISAPSDNGSVTGAFATGTILNDDASFSIANAATVVEGGNLIYTITRAGDASKSSVVNYTLAGTATAGDDYTTPNPLQALFAPGALSSSITLATKADGLREAQESATITLTSATAGTINIAAGANVGTGLINDGSRFDAFDFNKAPSNYTFVTNMGTATAGLVAGNGSDGSNTVQLHPIQSDSYAEVSVRLSSPINLRDVSATWQAFVTTDTVRAENRPYLVFNVDTDKNGTITGADARVIQFISGNNNYTGKGVWFADGTAGSTYHVKGDTTGLGTTFTIPNAGTLAALSDVVYSGTTKWGDLNVLEVRLATGDWGIGNYTAFVDNLTVFG